ncbi:MAG: acyl carrier protein [Marinisporobacter sp.]|nr:acyl carrier protein [Marinisporobacter sp.]
MRKEEFIKKIGESLFLEGEHLELDTKLEDLEGWDSVGRLGIIALFNEEFDKKIDPKKLKECESIADIVHFAKDELED